MKVKECHDFDRIYLPNIKILRPFEPATTCMCKILGCYIIYAFSVSLIYFGAEFNIFFYVHCNLV